MICLCYRDYDFIFLLPARLKIWCPFRFTKSTSWGPDGLIIGICVQSMHPITFGNPVAITKINKFSFFFSHGIKFDLYFEPFSANGRSDIDIYFTCCRACYLDRKLKNAYATDTK